MARSENHNPGSGPEPAGFWLRMGSLAADASLLLFAVVVLTLTAMRFTHDLLDTGPFLLFVLLLMLGSAFFLPLLYLGWANAGGRRSPGKRVFGLRVVSAAGGDLTGLRSAARALLALFDLLPGGLGFLFLLLNRQKRTVHDRLSGSRVVRVRPASRLESVKVGLAILAVTLVSVLSTALLQRDIQAFRIPSESLAPTLLPGDFILVDKIWSKEAFPLQGDLVVFRYPGDAAMVFGGRVIATGGQTLTSRANIIYIDGRPEGVRDLLERRFDVGRGEVVDEFRITPPQGRPYTIRHDPGKRARFRNFGPLVVPEGQVFVLDDNRDNSSDSRVWGGVPVTDLIGKVGLVYFSWDPEKKRVRWSRLGRIVN